MKKYYRTLLIIGVIGVALFAAGFILSKINIFKGDKKVGDYIEKTYESSTAENLDLSEFSDSVTVERGTGDKLIIVYHVPSNDDNVDITATDITVKFERKKTKPLLSNFFFNLNFENYKTTVTLPKDFKGDLNITTTSGSIKIGATECAKLYAKSTSGSVKINGIESRSTIEVNSTSGSIATEDFTCPKTCELNTTSGSVHASNITCVTLIAHTTSGSITTSAIDSKTASFKATSGSVKLENFTASESIGITTTSGSVSLNRLKSDSIKIDVGSGSVKGNIVGRESDYIIQATTMSGSKNLKDSSNGTKDLHVYTTSGSIKVTFTD